MSVANPNGQRGEEAWHVGVRSSPQPTSYGFTAAKQALAYAGLAPRLRQSGPWAGKTRLSKTGDPRVRKALYLPILSALAFNPVIRAFGQRLKAKGKHGMAIHCAAMRKLIHIAFAILKSGKPFDPNFTLA